MNLVPILSGMLDLLSSPEAWCKDWLAVDADGEPVWPEDDNAVAFCLNGAAQRVMFDQQISRSAWFPLNELMVERALEEPLIQGMRLLGGSPHVYYNNHPGVTYEDIRLFIKRCLLAAEEAEEDSD